MSSADVWPFGWVVESCLTLPDGRLTLRGLCERPLPTAQSERTGHDTVKGGFVACFGGGPRSTAKLDDAANALKWHTGTPEVYESGRLAVRVLADTTHGPSVQSVADRTLLVHGAPPGSLDELREGSVRFAALELDGDVLRASRDPLGEVPLFYRVVEDAVWLATEIHPLVAVAPAAADLAALSADAGFVPFDLSTGWQGIRRVRPGSTVVFDARGHEAVETYWRPERLLATRRCSYPEAVDEFRRLFERAVSRRLDTSSGVLLSGGLDSAAVAVVAGAGAHPPRLLTVTFPDLPDTDETVYARATADAAGLPLALAEGGSNDPWDAEAEPAIFGAPAHIAPTTVFETAAARFRADGVTTVLDGHDGDGALGLYRDIYGLLLGYLEVRRLAALASRYGWRDVGSRAVRETMSHWLPNARPSESHSLVQLFLPFFRDRTAERMRAETRRRGLRRSWRRWQIQPLTLPLTLVFEQMETEAARLGIDLVHPFADRDLLRFLVSLPFSVKVDPERSKPLLRDALADQLPDVVRLRTGKVWFNSVLERRVDPGACMHWIRESGVRLPDLDYEAFERAVERDPASPTVFGWIRLVRAHLFAAAAGGGL